jgi:hypothetical protein
MTQINNRADVLDSRDIIEELEALESEQGALIDEYNEAKEEADGEPSERLDNAINALSSFWDYPPEDIESAVVALEISTDCFNGLEELWALRQLAEQCEDCGDWLHGATLIRDTYFKEYAQELADDIGAIDSNAGWPTCHIDWDAAAESLRQDYTEVEFDGVTYLIRS